MGEGGITRVGLIGCGGIARAHARAARGISRLELTACCDLYPEKAASFAEAFAIPHVFKDLIQLVTSETCDLIFLTTWPGGHRDEVCAALEAGARALLCEKPLALALEDGLIIAEAVRAHDAFLMEGFMWRHHPIAARAKALLDDGAIGSLKALYAHFGAPDQKEDAEGHWLNQPGGGGIIAAKACYTMDAALYFADAEVKTAKAIAVGDPFHATQTGFSGLVSFENNVVAHLEANHRSMRREEVILLGEKGTLRIPVAFITREHDHELILERGVTWSQDRPEIEIIPVAGANAYARQLENARQVLCRETEPLVSLTDSVRHLRLKDALLRSAQETPA